MKYQVRWIPEAEEELVKIWLDAVDRKAITTAADQIDRWLASAPNTYGESRDRGRRIVFSVPLAVLYRTLAERGEVEVLAVWQY
ncbi:MAG: hypothetical protein IID44_03330 [Planctomycetes bacterium]|nr:hypothetical protein [Planctomycetota bacterium]